MECYYSSNKKTNLRKEIQFSQWLESMRKDVECVFGILKGIWRCLRNGIKLHGIDNCDKIWLTCCALHNMLLEVDGLAKRWEHGVQSVYETKLDHYDDLPSSLQKLAKPDSSRNFDISDISYGNDVNRTVVHTIVQYIEVPSEVVELSPDVVKSVSDISLHHFFQKLITHFDIAFKKKEIKWPKRTRVDSPIDLSST